MSSAMDEHIERRETALHAAGQALDTALLTLVARESIDLYRDAVLVDQLHRALNAIAGSIGTPWREERKERALSTRTKRSTP